jgi:hypothetical protein
MTFVTLICFVGYGKRQGRIAHRISIRAATAVVSRIGFPLGDESGHEKTRAERGFFEYPQGESNPCPLAENQIS